MPQKEETFQVIIDVIKNSTCFKAFTIYVDVPEIFMQTILNICPRVEGVDFTDVPDDETALTFLIDLGYKGPLNRHTNMLKFVKIGEDYHEYGLPILDVMLTDEIVDVSKESEREPGLTKKKTSSKRIVKKKITLSADDNIISDDPDIALELAKSISQTEAEEGEAARKVHATHARIMTEYVPGSAKNKSSGKSSKSVVDNHLFRGVKYLIVQVINRWPYLVLW
ncbi:hypothetical protein Tco_1077766 [Tanacetum coccineum]